MGCVPPELVPMPWGTRELTSLNCCIYSSSCTWFMIQCHSLCSEAKRRLFYFFLKSYFGRVHWCSYFRLCANIISLRVLSANWLQTSIKVRSTVAHKVSSILYLICLISDINSCVQCMLALTNFILIDKCRLKLGYDGNNFMELVRANIQWQQFLNGTFLSISCLYVHLVCVWTTEVKFS